MTGSVFISYRRDDSSGYARAITNQLREKLGPENIFIDVDAIEPGLDFVKAIEGAVGRCDVLLALIGPRWLDAGEERNRRLQNENDYVRTEIATALQRDIRVIPVLVGGAVMPASTDLPDDIIPLTRRNALEIRDTHFDADVEGLIDVLVKLVNPMQEQSPPGYQVAGGVETIAPDNAADHVNSGGREWKWKGATLLLFIFMGFVYFLFIDDLRVVTGNRTGTVRPESALITSSAITILALLITTVAAQTCRRRWWLGMVIGIVAFALLGFGAGVWIHDELRVRGDGPIIGAMAVWIVGLLVIIGQALWQRRRMKSPETGAI